MKRIIQRYKQLSHSHGRRYALHAGIGKGALKISGAIERALGIPKPSTRPEMECRLQQIEQRIREHACSVQAFAELQATSTVPAPRDGLSGDLLISVVVPTHRRARSVAVAIASVQQQTHSNWELLVVNDSADAQTRITVQALAVVDERIRYFEQPWLGVSRAVNLALDNARGDVIAYLDDDNTYYPHYLAAIARCYTDQQELQCAYAAQLWIGDGETAMVTFDQFDWAELLAGQISIDQNIFSHRTSLYHRLGGQDERLTRLIDWDQVLRYTAKETPERIPVLGVRYDWGSGERISNRRPLEASRILVLDKHAPPVAQPLRILVVSLNYPQLSESYVHAEIRWLQSRGVEIEVYSQQAPQSPGLPTAPVHSGDLADCISRVRPDIIHVHWLSQTEQYAAVLADAGKPVTVRAHGFDHHNTRMRNIAAQPWLRRIYAFPKLRPKENPGGKLYSLDAVVDTSRYYPVWRKDRRLVLRAGACLPTKDLESFVEIAALRPEYRFVLALSTNHAGTETADLVRQRNHDMGSPVDLRFDVQYEEIGALMREAGVYLHTFGYVQPFGQPVSVAEAMACGTVPILRNSRAARAYTGDAALYYNSVADAGSLLGRMLDWEDGQWESLARRGIDQAFAHHADAVILPALLDDWLSITGKKPAG